MKYTSEIIIKRRKLFGTWIFLFHLSLTLQGQSTCSSFNEYSLNPYGPMPSSWHQESPYNDSSLICPSYNEPMPIGCNAIAMGQVLNYYNYPNFSQSYEGGGFTYCHTDDNGKGKPHFYTISGNIFNMTIDNFLFSIALSIYTKFQRGASVQHIGYVEQALRVNFGFSEQQKIIAKDDQFWSQIASELIHCRPVIIAAMKTNGFDSVVHTFIIDDFRRNEVQSNGMDSIVNEFHCNFGFNDNSNGWYHPSDLNGYNLDQKAIINIVPQGLDACCHLQSLSTYPNYPKFNNTYSLNDISNISVKSSSCNNIEYPANTSDLINNKIAIIWDSGLNTVKNEVDIKNLDNNTVLYSNIETYGGLPILISDKNLPSNTNIEYTLKEYDLTNQLINSCTHSITTKDSICDLYFKFYNNYCIDNGTQYVVELDFEGNNTSYDLFAEWDGIVYDSYNSISPGFYILGPFDTSQRVAIVVEDELNPYNCFISEFTIPKYLSSTCFPNPISNNTGGSTQNPLVTCPVPSGFTASVNGNEVTYNWNWHANAQNIIIEEVLGSIILDTHVIGKDGNNNSLVINYSPCQEFQVKAKFDCGQYFGSYTGSTMIDMTHSSCNNPICPLPTNVSHGINSGNPDILNVSWNNDGSSHEICFYENGNLLNCSVKPPAQTSTGIFMNDCDNYDYQIRSICGSDQSNWFTNNESIQTGNNCGALTDLYPWGAAATVEITSTQIKLLNLQIVNNGNYATTSTIEIALFLEPSGHSAPMTYVTSIYYNISANSSIFDDFVFIYENHLPPQLASYGDANFKLHVLVDAQSSEPERNENNNTLTFHNYELAYGCDDPNAQTFSYNPNANVMLCYYCNDGIKNGLEKEVDCGGPWCPACCLNTYYIDNDGDGHGEVTQYVFDCTAPAGYVDNGIDCDDNDAAKYPGNAEICDNIDNDCDGLIDEDGVCCPESIVITDSLEVQNCTSDNIITVGQVLINSSQNIEYKSKAIRLLPGFNSKQGSVFKAEVDPCSN